VIGWRAWAAAVEPLEQWFHTIRVRALPALPSPSGGYSVTFLASRGGAHYRVTMLWRMPRPWESASLLRDYLEWHARARQQVADAVLMGAVKRLDRPFTDEEFRAAWREVMHEVLP
jgi:hypothetical protein